MGRIICCPVDDRFLCSDRSNMSQFDNLTFSPWCHRDANYEITIVSREPTARLMGPNTAYIVLEILPSVLVFECALQLYGNGKINRRTVNQSCDLEFPSLL